MVGFRPLVPNTFITIMVEEYKEPPFTMIFHSVFMEYYRAFIYKCMLLVQASNFDGHAVGGHLVLGRLQVSS